MQHPSVHILHLSAVPNWGGGEHHIENLCAESSTIDKSVKHLIFCVFNSLFHQRLKNSNLPYVTARLGIKIDPRYIFKLGRICKREKIDIIHIHDPTALQLAIIADKVFNLPPFVFSKKTSFPIKQRKKTLYKYNYPKIKKILCVSEETKRIASNAIRNTEKLITIYHGTNLRTKSSQTPFVLREKYAISTEIKIIGTIANHIRAKHLETWLKVIYTIVHVEKRTDFLFMQFGSYTDRTPELIQQSQTLHIEDYIRFMGYVPDASNFIPQFDISLITSQSEGIPQFIYESMYHGVPVISTNVGGIPEVIIHNENGLLADMHDSDTLAKHIITLAEQKALQQQYILKNQKRLNDQFTTTQMVQKTLSIYHALLS